MPVPLSMDRPITEKGVRALLVNSFITKRDAHIYPYFCEVRDSHVLEDYAAALGTVPQVEEVPYDVVAPEFADFTDYRLTWRNKVFAAIIAVRRTLLDFDQVGQTTRLMESLAARLSNWPDELFITRLRAADTIESYESSRNGVGTKFYFSTTHDLGDGTSQSNMIDGTTDVADFTAAGTPLIPDIAQKLHKDFDSALITLRGFKDERGKPWHPNEIDYGRLIILCSPRMQQAMELAFRGAFISQSDNIMRGKVKILSTSYLPTTGNEACDWYLFYNPGNNNKAFGFSRFRHITDAQIEDNAARLTGEGGSAELSDTIMNTMRDLSAVELSTNLNRRGMNADADTMLNERFLIKARWMGEIFPLVWQNCVKVLND